MTPEERRRQGLADGALLAVLRLALDREGGAFVALSSGGGAARIFDGEAYALLEGLVAGWKAAALRYETARAPAEVLDLLEEIGRKRESIDQAWRLVSAYGIPVLQAECDDRVPDA